MRQRLIEDCRGATLLEYSVLIGLLLALSIALIVFAGEWSASQWTVFQNEVCKLPDVAANCNPPGQTK